MHAGFWLAAALGAATLLVEAYRQFVAPVEHRFGDRYVILKDLDLEALCTKAELIRGFLVYALLYLLLYGLFLVSAEAFQVFVGFSGGASPGDLPVAGAGPTASDSFPGSDAETMSDPARPLIISSVMIVALTSGVVKPIDRILRGLAHMAASVPSGIYRVISGIEQVDYAEVLNGQGTPLKSAYLTATEGLGHSRHDNSVSDTLRFLEIADALRPAVLGTERVKAFPGHLPEKIASLIAGQSTVYDVLVGKLRVGAIGDTDLPGLKDEAKRISESLQALFGLLYIKNRRIIDAEQAGTAATRIIRKLQFEREAVLHALAGAIIIMVIIVMPLAYAAYLITTRDSSAPPEVVAAFINRNSLLVTLNASVMLGLSVGIALWTREGCKEAGRWRDWDWPRVPFGLYATNAIFPALLAVVAAVTLKAGEFILTGLRTADLQMFVTTNFAFCAMCFGFGFFISIAVFLIVDQYTKVATSKTLLIAVVAVIPYLIWAFFTQSFDQGRPPGLDFWTWRLREIFLLAAPAFTFVMAFSCVLEWQERSAK